MTTRGTGSLGGLSLMTYTTDTLVTRSRHVSNRIDPILLVTTLVLALTVIVMIYSATRS